MAFTGLPIQTTPFASSEFYRYYGSRGEFEAAIVADDVPAWSVLEGDQRKEYMRDPTGTDIESANGVKGRLLSIQALDDVTGRVDVIEGEFSDLSNSVGDVDGRLDDLEAIGATGMTPKQAVVIATTANVTLSGEQTIDGVLTSTSRILVRAQTAPAQNGIYVTGASGWTRATDMDAAGEVVGSAVYVNGGTVNGGKTFYTGSVVTTLGTDAISWTEISNQAALQEQVNARMRVADYASILPDVDPRESGGATFTISDNDDQIAFEVQPDGLTYIHEALMAAPDVSDIRSDGEGFIPLFYDAEGQVALGLTSGLMSGATYVRGLVMEVPDVSDLRADGEGFIPLYFDSLGRIALGIQNGEFWFDRLAPDAEQVILDVVGGGSVQEPSAWGGDYNVGGPIQTVGDRQYVTVREDGMSSPIVRNVEFSDIGIVSSTSPIKMWTWQGQSNADNSGTSATATYTIDRFPHHALQYSLGHRPALQNVLEAESNFTDFAPTRSISTKAAAPGVMFSIAYEGQKRMANRTGDGTLTWTAAQGGSPLINFLPPDDPDVAEAVFNWENLILGAEKANDVAAIYGRTVEVAGHFYIGNEAGFAGLATTDDWLAWGPGFAGQYLEQVRAALKTATGQDADVPVYFFQTNMRDTASGPSSVELAQVNIARTLAADDPQVAWLVMPLYAAPLDPDPLDEIHNSEIGRMFIGDVTAAVVDQIERGVGFTPPWVTSATRLSATITATFAATPEAGPLTIDTDWLPATPNQGFRVLVDGSPLTISSVTVTGANTVQIVVATTPAGTWQLEMGRGNHASTGVRDGWSSGRTNLYRTTTKPCFFYAEWAAGRVSPAAYADAPGAPQRPPEFVRHYIPRDLVAIT
jgi:hypothetical protein